MKISNSLSRLLNSIQSSHSKHIVFRLFCIMTVLTYTCFIQFQIFSFLSFINIDADYIVLTQLIAISCSIHSGMHESYYRDTNVFLGYYLIFNVLKLYAQRTNHHTNTSFILTLFRTMVLKSVVPVDISRISGATIPIGVNGSLSNHKKHRFRCLQLSVVEYEYFG